MSEGSLPGPKLQKKFAFRPGKFEVVLDVSFESKTFELEGGKEVSSEKSEVKATLSSENAPPAELAPIPPKLSTVRPVLGDPVHGKTLFDQARKGLTVRMMGDNLDTTIPAASVYHCDVFVSSSRKWIGDSSRFSIGRPFHKPEHCHVCTCGSQKVYFHLPAESTKAKRASLQAFSDLLRSSSPRIKTLKVVGMPTLETAPPHTVVIPIVHTDQFMTQNLFCALYGLRPHLVHWSTLPSLVLSIATARESALGWKNSQDVDDSGSANPSS